MQPFLTANLSPDLSRRKNDTTAATAFLKNAFSIVGTSPDILTKKVIREKPSAARRMQIIPLDLLLNVFNLSQKLQEPVEILIVLIVYDDLSLSRIRIGYLQLNLGSEALLELDLHFSRTQIEL